MHPPLPTPPHHQQLCLPVRTRDGLFVIAPDTGLIVDQERTTKDPKPHHIEAYVGIDTRYPAQARDPEELITALAVYDPFLSHLSIDYERLWGLLDTGTSVLAVKVFEQVCKRLHGWNYWFGRTAELFVEIGQHSRASLYRAWESLQPTLIQTKPISDQRTLQVRVNPWYAWRGNSYFQEQAARRWYESLIAQNTPQ